MLSPHTVFAVSLLLLFFFEQPVSPVSAAVFAFFRSPSCPPSLAFPIFCPFFQNTCLSLPSSLLFISPTERAPACSTIRMGRSIDKKRQAKNADGASEKNAGGGLKDWRASCTSCFHGLIVQQVHRKTSSARSAPKNFLFVCTKNPPWEAFSYVNFRI